MTVGACNTTNLHSSGATFLGETKSQEDCLRSLCESTPLLGMKTPAVSHNILGGELRPQPSAEMPCQPEVSG